MPYLLGNRDTHTKKKTRPRTTARVIIRTLYCVYILVSCVCVSSRNAPPHKRLFVGRSVARESTMGSLSTGVFEPRTAAESQMFSFLAWFCSLPRTGKSLVLIVCGLMLQTRWRQNAPKGEKFNFRLPSVAQKRLCLSSPIHRWLPFMRRVLLSSVPALHPGPFLREEERGPWERGCSTSRFFPRQNSQSKRMRSDLFNKPFCSPTRYFKPVLSADFWIQDSLLFANYPYSFSVTNTPVWIWEPYIDRVVDIGQEISRVKD